MEKNKAAELPDFLYRNEADLLYGPAVTSPPEKIAFDREMAELAEKMVLEVGTLFDEQGVDLDYSDESLEELDRLINQLWHEPVEDEDALAAMVANWGAYLGVTIIQNVGGEWVFRKDLEQASIFFPRTEMEAYPLHKLRKRFMLGPMESIADFYEALVQELTEN